MCGSCDVSLSLSLSYKMQIIRLKLEHFNHTFHYLLTSNYYLKILNLFCTILLKI
jgi:hypothetical protein